MSAYIQLNFLGITQEQSDLLVAHLSGIGFEGFEEEDGLLKAFVPVEVFDNTSTDRIARSLSVGYSATGIPERNWNQVWESNFQPVIVDDFVAIRADFHQPSASVAHDVIITPKMSFGTGHHATTYMMVQQMRSIDFLDRSILDFGTGTGVLAILAEKLGARQVLAIDNDSWSIANAAENTRRNNCSRIELKQASTAVADQHFDVVLANINKNVILDNLNILARQLFPGAVMLLSGLLQDDQDEVLAKARDSGFQLKDKVERDNWLLLKLSP